MNKTTEKILLIQFLDSEVFEIWRGKCRHNKTENSAWIRVWQNNKLIYNNDYVDIDKHKYESLDQLIKFIRTL